MSATDAATRSRSLRTTDLEDVLLADSSLVNAHRKAIDYLLRLEPDRFLFGFATNAGLTTAAEVPDGGWERTSGTRFQGHFFGHDDISALAQAYAGTTQETEKAELLAKLSTAVHGLKLAQAAYARRTLRTPATYRRSRSTCRPTRATISSSRSTTCTRS
jgi:uncharacterized protein